MTLLTAIISHVGAAVITFFVLALLFMPLERVFRARPARGSRPQLVLDLLFFAGQHLIWTGLVVSCLQWVARGLHLDAPGRSARTIKAVASP